MRRQTLVLIKFLSANTAWVKTLSIGLIPWSKWVPPVSDPKTTAWMHNFFKPIQRGLVKFQHGSSLQGVLLHFFFPKELCKAGSIALFYCNLGQDLLCEMSWQQNKTINSIIDFCIVLKGELDIAAALVICRREANKCNRRGTKWNSHTVFQPMAFGIGQAVAEMTV